MMDLVAKGIMVALISAQILVVIIAVRAHILYYNKIGQRQKIYRYEVAPSNLLKSK